MIIKFVFFFYRVSLFIEQLFNGTHLFGHLKLHTHRLRGDGKIVSAKEHVTNNRHEEFVLGMFPISLGE